jgi:tetratricopeptide (TPR) repeat protein
MNRVSLLIRELRRRHVTRSGLAYIVTAWLGVEVVDILSSAFQLPSLVLQIALIVAIVCFVPVLVFSWFFEVSANGIVRTEDLPYDAEPIPPLGRRLDFAIIAILAAAVSLSVYSNLRPPEKSPEPISILIADFDDMTTTALLSGVVEESLRVGLEVAPFVDAFSRKTARSIAASIGGTDPEATVLDSETAGLIALRQGLDIVIGGRISHSDGELVISATAMSPRDHQQLFSVTEVVEDDAEILSGVSAVAKRLRYKLGYTDGQSGEGAQESFAVANLEAAAEYLKAQDLQLDRRLEEAREHYRRALELDPEFARAYAGLALTEQYLGNTEAAQVNWSAALARLDTLTERGQLRTLANYYMINQRNYQQAIVTYERLIQHFPGDNVAHNNLAVTLFYALDFERALEVGRVVAERFPEHSGYGANLALFAMYASRFDEATEVAKRVIEIDPSNVYALTVMALTDALAGKLVEAEKIYERMAGLDQYGKSIAHEGLADLAMSSGDDATAISLLDRAIDAEKQLGSMHSVALKYAMRTEALLRLGKHEAALAASEEALVLGAGDPAVLVPVAIALVVLDRADRAEAIAVELENSVSRSDRAYAGLIRARISEAQGDLQSAIEQAEAALNTADLWLIRAMLADLYFEMGQNIPAASERESCRQRLGEGLAVFLDDRPTFRRVVDFNDANDLGKADSARASNGASSNTDGWELEVLAPPQ